MININAKKLILALDIIVISAIVFIIFLIIGSKSFDRIAGEEKKYLKSAESSPAIEDENHENGLYTNPSEGPISQGTPVPKAPDSSETNQSTGSYLHLTDEEKYRGETWKKQPALKNRDAGDHKIAYITIDDGPSSKVTTRMLDTLKHYGVKATFFVLHHDGVDDIYKRIVDEGHTIGNHSYSHEYKKLYKEDNLESFKEDVTKNHEFIKSKTGIDAAVFRFPGGAMVRKTSLMDPRVNFLAEKGYTFYDWDVSTGDSDTGKAGKDKESLANNVLNNTRNRRKLVILMHDLANKSATADALPLIIEGLKEQGYIFDTVDHY